jgi:hypothetical protein
MRLLISVLAALVLPSQAFVVGQSQPSRRMTYLSMSDTPSYKYVAQGMDLFREGDVEGSIKSFDASVPPGSNAYLWQRGLSYYYADEFGKGSKQFRDDVMRSPLDVEEIVWDIACLLRMDPAFPPPNMMSLPPGKTDRRPIMVSSQKAPGWRAVQVSSFVSVPN